MKVIKLLHKKLGLVNESVIRSETDEEDIRKEWRQLYGFLSAARFENFKIVTIDSEILNPYTLPRKLNRSKYDLVMNNEKPVSIVTEKHNREEILKLLISIAKEKGVHFIIYLTEDGIKSVLVDSKLDNEFINFIYEHSR